MPDVDDVVIETGTPNSTGVRGDLNFRLIVMRQIDRCGMILSKLPNEFQDPQRNEKGGCKYEDIQQSFFDGVRLLESLVVAYRDAQYLKDTKELVDEYDKAKDPSPREYYFDKYANIISLCARLGLMLEPTGEDVV